MAMIKLCKLQLDSANDGYESTSASISYTVAPGVSAILGFSDSTSSNEGF